MKVLAIESSCDDTSIAIVKDDKSVEFLETINHRKFHKDHGALYEMAARQHLEILDTLVKSIKKLFSISAIAAMGWAQGGLIVGSSFAKGYQCLKILILFQLIIASTFIASTCI